MRFGCIPCLRGLCDASRWSKLRGEKIVVLQERRQQQLNQCAPPDWDITPVAGCMLTSFTLQIEDIRPCTRAWKIIIIRHYFILQAKIVILPSPLFLIIKTCVRPFGYKTTFTTIGFIQLRWYQNSKISGILGRNPKGVLQFVVQILRSSLEGRGQAPASRMDCNCSWC